MKLKSILTLLAICLSLNLFAKSDNTKHLIKDIIEYKKVDTISLKMMMIKDKTYKNQRNSTAIVLFHGGGWISGTYDVLMRQGEYYAQQGATLFLVGYRTEKGANSTPYEALLDAKSAYRYIYENAKELRIDRDKIVLGGGSAGGQLAMGIEVCDKINDPQDNLKIEPHAAAMILFNPVICNGPDKKGKYKGYGYERVKDYYKEFSPIHNIKGNIPPTLFMVGSEDNLVPTEVACEFQRLIQKCGGLCDLKIYGGAKHGFYNAYGLADTTRDTHIFLSSLGLLNKPWDESNYNKLLKLQKTKKTKK